MDEPPPLSKPPPRPERVTARVSDTSVLVDLERGALLEASFRLPFEFTVPDLLYERELRDYGGPALVNLGLKIAELDGDGVSLALGYRRKSVSLSLPDSFALALARTNSWILLSGDGRVARTCRRRGRGLSRSAVAARPDVRGTGGTRKRSACRPRGRSQRIRDAGYQRRRSRYGFASIPVSDPAARPRTVIRFMRPAK